MKANLENKLVSALNRHGFNRFNEHLSFNRYGRSGNTTVLVAEDESGKRGLRKRIYCTWVDRAGMKEGWERRSFPYSTSGINRMSIWIRYI